MTLYHLITLSAILFVIGLFGVITRRNVIGILMSIELMFNAANINFAAFNKFLYADSPLGQLMVILKSEIRNSKSETNSNNNNSKFKTI
ncbi:MAG: NADH-quinone oxidoreductase subunit NuoK [Elusimicrobia bacterium]|nr:NADH-quinone oxidoreductase subunit NuoK [Elusimicrobiota bacterium]